jgi:hypothetical protein
VTSVQTRRYTLMHRDFWLELQPSVSVPIAWRTQYIIEYFECATAHGHKGFRPVIAVMINLHRLAGKCCSNSLLRETLDQIPLDRCTAEVMKGAERCDGGRGIRR